MWEKRGLKKAIELEVRVQSGIVKITTKGPQMNAWNSLTLCLHDYTTDSPGMRGVIETFAMEEVFFSYVESKINTQYIPFYC